MGQVTSLIEMKVILGKDEIGIAMRATMARTTSGALIRNDKLKGRLF